MTEIKIRKTKALKEILRMYNKWEKNWVEIILNSKTGLNYFTRI